MSPAAAVSTGVPAEFARDRRRRGISVPRILLVPLCAVLGFALPAIFGSVQGIQEPYIHDEFGYLLGADTFARGRLTNPSPDLPRFFESPHILVTPSYQSKYPPAQSLMLAAGQVLFGHPIWGVWLSCGLFAGSLVWMLQAWTSRHWALTVTVVMVLTIGTTDYWAQSYWGGMLGATGGALLFGAVRRITTKPTLINGVLIGTALILLANTRPLEGGIAALPAGVLILRWLLFGGPRLLLTRLAVVALPIVSIVTLSFLLLGIYNRAVTGDPLRAPYDVHIEQYLYRGVFIFSGWKVPTRQPVERVDSFYRRLARSPQRGWDLVVGFVRNLVHRVFLSINAPFGGVIDMTGGPKNYRGVLLWPLLLPSVWARRSIGSFTLITVTLVVIELAVWRSATPVYPVPLAVLAAAFVIASRLRLPRGSWWHAAGVTVMLVLGAQALVQWWLPHYVSPIYPLLLAGMAAGLRRSSACLSVPAASQLPPRLLTVFVVQAAAILISATLLRIPQQQTVREYVRQELLARRGAHLVFVSYSPDYMRHRDWVYNDADLTNTPVLFAHDLGPEENRHLIRSNPGRAVWRLAVSRSDSQLSTYR